MVLDITDGKNNGYVWHWRFRRSDFTPLNLPDIVSL
jgi:hypothetical protein